MVFPPDSSKDGVIILKGHLICLLFSGRTPTNPRNTDGDDPPAPEAPHSRPPANTQVGQPGGQSKSHSPKTLRHIVPLNARGLCEDEFQNLEPKIELRNEVVLEY